MKLILFVVPGMADNMPAYEKLKLLPEVEIEQVQCPASMQQWYDYPYVRDENGISYYRLEGITEFAENLPAEKNNIRMETTCPA